MTPRRTVCSLATGSDDNLLFTKQRMACQFSPHPIWRQGATHDDVAFGMAICTFQSSPHPETECDTRRARDSGAPALFQSSPHPETGSDLLPLVHHRDGGGFNPHPIRRQGATFSPSVTTIPSAAAFQSSPHPETGCDWRGRVRWLRDDTGFNPHPIRRQGATMCGRWWRTPSSTFQSSPHPETGCDCQVTSSISVASLTFQSSPHPETGCDTCSTASATARAGFQSSPHPETGCDLPVPGVTVIVPVFQSSPHPETGCDRLDRLRALRHLRVSILTPSGDRVRRRHLPNIRPSSVVFLAPDDTFRQRRRVVNVRSWAFPREPAGRLTTTSGSRMPKRHRPAPGRRDAEHATIGAHAGVGESSGSAAAWRMA